MSGTAPGAATSTGSADTGPSSSVTATPASPAPSTSNFSPETLLPGRSDIEHTLRERLLAHYPAADTCVFLKTGSEAVAAAIRFARAHTGRRTVLRVGFHGWHDGLIDPKIGWHNWDNVRTPASDPPGVPPAAASGVEIDHARTSDDIAGRLHATDKPALATVVVDPIQLTDATRDLPRLRRACDDAATFLVLDETKTAFRVAPGGVQALYQVHADLTVAGKALANGLPLSSVLGPADLVRPKATRVKGTFSGERAALAAAHATLDALENDDLCTRLDAIGAALIAAVNDALADTPMSHLVTAVPYRWNAMPHLHAATDDPTALHARHQLVASCQQRGVLLLDGHNSFVNAAHNHDDIGRTTRSPTPAGLPLRRVLVLVLEHHPHRTLTHLDRVLAHPLLL